MRKSGIDDLSDAELQWLADFLTETSSPFMQTVAKAVVSPDYEAANPFGAGYADVLFYLSDSVAELDRQVMRFDDMRRGLDTLIKKSPSDIEIPEGVEVTPKMLYWFSIRTHLTSYYSQAGVLIEDLSTRLILNEVVDDDRISNRIEEDIRNKSQANRDWLLFATGVVDDSEKGEIRSTYRKRSDLVHHSGEPNPSAANDADEWKSEIAQAWSSVNILHEKLFGIGMEFRISEILIGNDFPARPE